MEKTGSFLNLVPALTHVDRPVLISKQILFILLEEPDGFGIETNFRVVCLDMSNLQIPVLLAPLEHASMNNGLANRGTLASGSDKVPITAMFPNKGRMENLLEVGTFAEDNITTLLRCLPVSNFVVLPSRIAASSAAPGVVPAA